MNALRRSSPRRRRHRRKSRMHETEHYFDAFELFFFSVFLITSTWLEGMNFLRACFRLHSVADMPSRGKSIGVSFRLNAELIIKLYKRK